MGGGDAEPAGLLFTDLEGSTAHLRALGDRYSVVLGRKWLRERAPQAL